jgi:predicted amidohydrolase YtcJ
MDDVVPRARGVAVRDGKVAELLLPQSKESEAEWCVRLRPTRTIRLRSDEALFPGFCDPHSHMLNTGISLLRCSLAGCSDMAELLGRIKSWVASRPGEKIVIGVSYDDTKLQEMRHPTRPELDSVTAGRRVVVQHVSGHVGVANTEALALVKGDNELISEFFKWFYFLG